MLSLEIEKIVAVDVIYFPDCCLLFVKIILEIEKNKKKYVLLLTI